MGKVFISVREEDKPYLETMARNFLEQGYGLCATRGTAKCLTEMGFFVQTIHKVAEGRPHVVDFIKNGEIAVVVNTVSSEAKAIEDSHSIRRSALNQRIPLYTTLAGGEAVSEGVKSMFAMDVYSVQELHAQLAKAKK
jgi:carbamoyl-phosphate synthase large subunit